MAGEDFGLRERLDVALERLAPSAPPVAAVVRRGQIMRIAQRAAIGAGLAVVIAATVAVPQFITRHAPEVTTRPHGLVVKPRPYPKLSMVRLAATARGGVIAEGRSRGGGWDGTWRIWISKRTGKVYAGLAGAKVWTLGSLSRAEHVSGIEAFGNASIEAWPGTFGVVRPDITRIAVEVSGHQVLTLRPVIADGFHWVGLMFPIGFAIVRETAYAGRAVVGRLTTFHGMITGWRAGSQPGPSPVTVPLGSGVLPGGQRWRLAVDAGPWGFCLAPQTGVVQPDIDGYCLSIAAARSAGLKWVLPQDPGRNVRWLVGTATAATTEVRVLLANGRTLTAPVADVDGQRFFAVCVERGLAIQRWGAFDASGRKLFGGLG